METRTGWYVDDNGIISERLHPAELLERCRQLNAMGGPCDVRDWDDVSPEERELLSKPPPQP